MQLLFTCCCVKDTAFLPFFPPGISRFRHFRQKRCCCRCCRSCCTAGTAVVMVAAAVAVTAAVAVAAAVAGGQCPSRLLLRLFLLRVLLPAPAPAPSCSPHACKPAPPPKKLRSLPDILAARLSLACRSLAVDLLRACPRLASFCVPFHPTQ